MWGREDPTGQGVEVVLQGVPVFAPRQETEHSGRDLVLQHLQDPCQEPGPVGEGEEQLEYVLDFHSSTSQTAVCLAGREVKGGREVG